MFSLYGKQFSQEEFLLLELFRIVLCAQFETANEYSNLLRANTPASRMLTTFTRRGSGQSYLKSVVGSHIQLICEAEESLEINPEKLGGEEDLEGRCNKLVCIANTLLTALIDSLDEIPFGIRWICKQIRIQSKVNEDNILESLFGYSRKSFKFTCCSVLYAPIRESGDSDS